MTVLPPAPVVRSKSFNSLIFALLLIKTSKKWDKETAFAGIGVADGLVLVANFASRKRMKTRGRSASLFTLDLHTLRTALFPLQATSPNLSIIVVSFSFTRTK